MKYVTLDSSNLSVSKVCLGCMGFVKEDVNEPGCRNNWHIHHAKSGGGQILIC